jgi:uncharacterized paraquat-inducible protein A
VIKKVISWFFIFVLFLSNIGIHADIEYCCDDIINISFSHQNVKQQKSCCQMAAPAKSVFKINNSEKGCMSSEEFIKIPHFQDLSITSGITIPSISFVFLENVLPINQNFVIYKEVNTFYNEASPPGIPDYHPSQYACFLC